MVIMQAKQTKSWLHRLWVAWLNKRIPASESITLHYRQIFIFPTKSGFGYALLLLLVMIGATNYQNNLAFALNFWLISLGFLSIVHTFRNILGLTIRCQQLAPVNAGNEAIIRLSLSSNKVKQAIEFGFSRQPNVRVPFVDKQGQVAELSLKVNKRGWHDIPRVYIQTLYPLGLIHAWSWLTFSNRLLVYPRPLEPPALNLHQHDNGNEDSGDTQNVRGDEFHGHRQYAAGDSVKQIDWKVYARERGVMSRDLRAPQSSQHILAWEQFAGVDNETRLSYLCFLVLEKEQQQQQYGLHIPGVNIGLGTGIAHMNRCLEALALWGSDTPKREAS